MPGSAGRAWREDMIEIIRVATREQIQTTATLAAEIWQEHYTPIIGADQVKYMIARFQGPEAITQQIDSGELVYFLIHFAGNAEGYFAIQLRPNEVFLSKLYVRARMRGRGLAARTLQFVKAIAADNCLKRISLTVNKNNKLALQAYEKLGFANEGPTVTNIGGGFVMDDYILALNMTK